MKFLEGRGLWWFLGVFHLCAVALVVWFLSMVLQPAVSVGVKWIVVPKLVLGAVIWLVVAGPLTVALLVARRLLKH